MKNSNCIIGLMSGTSLDGLDLAAVRFKEAEEIQFELLCAETIKYPEAWQSALSNAFYRTPDELKQLDIDYGKFLGELIVQFINKNNFSPDLIASHGHTVFHQPNKGFTLQIGSGQAIRDISRVTVINNFRVADVALGGQGAPLVPMGDELLFPQYDFCLNLGGFSNISWKHEGKRLACDIGICNMLLNEICQKKSGLEYDPAGENASRGNPIPSLLHQWNSIQFFAADPPKSLGREWYHENFKAIAEDRYTLQDLLATANLHIAYQIHRFINRRIEKTSTNNPQYNILVTGGGAHNNFLVESLNNLQSGNLNYHLPEPSLIDFKEAIVFALLGYLRWQKRINVLASVTGASHDHTSGDVYHL